MLEIFQVTAIPTEGLVDGTASEAALLYFSKQSTWSLTGRTPKACLDDTYFWEGSLFLPKLKRNECIRMSLEEVNKDDRGVGSPLL